MVRADSTSLMFIAVVFFLFTLYLNVKIFLDYVYYFREEFLFATDARQSAPDCKISFYTFFKLQFNAAKWNLIGALNQIVRTAT